MRTPRVALVVVALWGACEPSHPERSTERELKPQLTAVTGTSVRTTPVKSSSWEPPGVSCKPEPPVAIALTSRPLPGSRYELTVTATPSATVDSLDLAFVVPAGATIDRSKAAFGATGSGQQRVMTVIVEPRDRTTEISAIVKVPVDGIAMTKAATVTLGDPKPVPRTVVYAMPDGERAREVRP